MAKVAIVTGSDSGIGKATAVALARAGFDVLVNNASTGHSAPFLDHGVDEWRRVLDVDLTGPFCCAQRAARRMVAAGGGGSGPLNGSFCTIRV